MNTLVFYLVYIFLWVLAWLPLRFLYVFSDIIYLFNFYVLQYRKAIVFENLRNSFPLKTETEIKIIAKKFYRHFSDLLVETIKLIHFSQTDINKHISFKNPEVFDHLFDQGKHVSAALAHYGNWEWLTGLVEQIPYPVVSIYKPLKNKPFDNFINNLRKKFGTELVPMEKTMLAVLNKKQQNKPTIFVFITDQTPIWIRIKHWTMFLNQETPVFLGIEKVAGKVGHAVVYISINKVMRGKYEAEIHLLTEDASTLAPLELTEMHVRLLEKIIEEKPEYWLWSHRRWKRKKLFPEKVTKKKIIVA